MQQPESRANPHVLADAVSAHAAHGHVVGPGYRVSGEIVDDAAHSIQIRWTVAGQTFEHWFNAAPGRRQWLRHGDTGEGALRWEAVPAEVRADLSLG